MTPRIVRKGLYRALGQIRHVTPVRPGRAPADVAEVYRQVERDFGMLAPPIALHSPEPAVLRASWVMLRETLVAPGSSDRADREAVAAAVSLANQCPYCLDVHTASLRGVSSAGDAAALAAGRIEAIADPGRRAYARAALDGTPGVLPAELLGVALTFHYLNRMVNVFLTEQVLPSQVPGAAHGPMMAMMGRLVGSAARQARPGDALPLLPAAALPRDLAWAEASPNVADALARCGAAIDEVGARVAAADVRDLVGAHVRGWDGTPPPLGLGWLDDEVAVLPAALRPAAALALSVARDSARSTDARIEAFRRTGADDAALVGLAAWASLVTARHLTGRLAG